MNCYIYHSLSHSWKVLGEECAAFLINMIFSYCFSVINLYNELHAEIQAELLIKLCLKTVQIIFCNSIERSWVKILSEEPCIGRKVHLVLCSVTKGRLEWSFWIMLTPSSLYCLLKQITVSMHRTSYLMGNAMPDFFFQTLYSWALKSPGSI